MDAPHVRGTGLAASVLAVVGCALLLAACSTRFVTTERGPQAYYQTGFPAHDTSREIERIFQSVKQIQVTGFYTAYRFAREDGITEADVQQRATFRRAVETYNFNHAKSATATIIGTTSTGIRLLSSDHGAQMPDTIIVYFRELREGASDRRAARIVESVSVKTSQLSIVLELPEVAHFRVAARDTLNDLAILHADLRQRENLERIRALRVRQGDPSRLVWGSFVYVLGYPRGYKMVTRAIVSDPNRRPDSGFLLDGLFNRGVSGGPIFAVRGETGELEWVGMARSTSSQVESLLLPEPRDVDTEGMLLPYEGRLYMEQVARIDYGITFSTPMTAIQRFLRGTGAPLQTAEAD